MATTFGPLGILALVSSIANEHGRGVSLRESKTGGVRLECNGIRVATAR